MEMTGLRFADRMEMASVQNLASQQAGVQRRTSSGEFLSRRKGTGVRSLSVTKSFCCTPKTKGGSDPLFALIVKMVHSFGTEQSNMATLKRRTKRIRIVRRRPLPMESTYTCGIVRQGCIAMISMEIKSGVAIWETFAISGGEAHHHCFTKIL